MNVQEIKIKDFSTKLIHLKNDFISAEIVSYGAHLHKLFCKDKNGKFDNVVLNLDNIADYESDAQYFGATVGPFAGRIANKKILGLNLSNNEKSNVLHSGKNGWSFQEWEIANVGSDFVELSLLDATSKFAKTYTATVKFSLIKNKLLIEFSGKADADTLFNPTNHAYWNLCGSKSRKTIHEHLLKLDASSLCQLDEDKIPTGRFLEDTIYNFSQAKYLKEALNKLANGLDDVFVLQEPGKLELSEEITGRKLTVISDSSAVVLYSASNYKRKTIIDGGAQMQSEFGLAIEFQELPNPKTQDKNFYKVFMPKGETRTKFISYEFDLI